MTMKKTRSAAAAAAAVILGCAAKAKADAVPPVPGATAIAGTTMCLVDGWEYAPRWSTPNNGYISPSVEECAADCEADAVCTGATYITNNDGNNCWFKDWGAGPVAPPCYPDPNKSLEYQAIIDPAGADCAAITYMAIDILTCDAESMIDEKPTGVGAAAAAGPVAAAATTTTDVAGLEALDPPYVGHAGSDYSPNQVPPPAVGIVDIGGGTGGMTVADAIECATACSADPTCNAASYYGDNPVDTWPGGDNCYLKTLQGCELPADAEVKTDATIFMIGGAPCADGGLALPPAGAATGPGALLPTAPAAAPPAPVAVAPVAAAAAPTLAPTLGFSPAPGGVPPLTTTAGGIDASAPAPSPASASAGAGTTTGTRDAELPPAETDTAAESGTATGTGTTVASGASGVLPSLAAAASTAVGAALLL